MPPSKAVIAASLAAAIWTLDRQAPAIGAAAVLHPARRPVTSPAPPNCTDESFPGAGVRLRGWRCRSEGSRRAVLVFLHGVADNRMSASGVIARFRRKGFDVVAYDSRAHGESEGEFCSYGVLEKHDLHRVIDTLGTLPVVVIGSSLGGAVALQEAAGDERVRAVVAAETFSDLRTVASDRAPFFVTRRLLARAFDAIARDARFSVDDASPVAAAARITAPVLLIHGDADTDTPPAHSQRVFAALRGPKRLLLVPGARHNESLRGEVWDQIDRWLDDSLSTVGATRSTASMRERAPRMGGRMPDARGVDRPQ